MRTMPAAMSIDERPGVWVLTARGELDYAECAAFRKLVERIVSEMPAACIVDFSGIDYLDSSGLGLLLSLYREYGGAGGHLVLVASDTVDGILEITRLDNVFTTSDTVGGALASVGIAASST
jgi:anti-sigma B factor antagonist